MLTWKIPLRRCRSSWRCAVSSAVLPLLGSQSAFWSLFKRRQRCQRKDVSINSVLTRNGNGRYGTELRQRYNGTAKRQNGNGSTATECWKVETRRESRWRPNRDEQPRRPQERLEQCTVHPQFCMAIESPLRTCLMVLTISNRGQINFIIIWEMDKCYFWLAGCRVSH